MSCITGIGEGDLGLEGAPLETRSDHPQYRQEWKDLLAERAPLLLVALGQYLSSAPAFLDETPLKKTSAPAD